MSSDSAPTGSSRYIRHAKAETARAVRQRIRSVLEWAIAMDLRNENKPMRHGRDSMVLSIFGSVDVAIVSGPPLRIGNTSRLPPPSVCASSRTSTARPRSGTRRRASP